MPAKTYMIRSHKWLVACLCATIILPLSSCEKATKTAQTTTPPNTTTQKSDTSPPIAAEVEKVKPASGTGNDKPIQKGTYRWEVEAYNSDDQKLAENSRDIKFTIH